MTEPVLNLILDEDKAIPYGCDAGKIWYVAKLSFFYLFLVVERYIHWLRPFCNMMTTRKS